MRTSYKIRIAVIDDLRKIRDWIYRFKRNLNFIKNSINNQQLAVIEINNSIVGFLAYTPSELSLLEIHSDHRRKGYGKALVEWSIQQYFEQNINVARIQCTPETSIPFWKNMGFDITGVHGHKILERDLNNLESDLINSGRKKAVSIKFYPEEKLYINDTPPLISHTTEATLTSKNKIALPKRAICYHTKFLQTDLVISINIDGQDFYLNKAKRECAQNIGVKKDNSGIYYIDTINYKPLKAKEL